RHITAALRVLHQTMLTYLAAPRAQRGDRGDHVQAVQPVAEARDLLAHDHERLLRLRLPPAQVPRHLGLDVVHVIELDPRAVTDARLDVARHREGDQYQRRSY